MTSLIPKRAKGLIHRVLGKAGLRLVPLTPSSEFDLPELRAHWLQKLNIDVVIDVGANVGQFVGNIRAGGYRSDIVSFEPQQKAYAALEKAFKSDKRWKGYRCGLASEEGKLTMQVAGNSMSSSMLPMLDSHSNALPESAIVGTETVPVRRLDVVLSSEIDNWNSAFLKIDAQGFEAQVLQGATAIMPKVTMVELELSLVPLYEGQDLLPAMLERMDRAGFAPIAMEHGFADPIQHRILQVDGLFIAKDQLEHKAGLVP